MLEVALSSVVSGSILTGLIVGLFSDMPDGGRWGNVQEGNVISCHKLLIFLILDFKTGKGKKQ